MEESGTWISMKFTNLNDWLTLTASGKYGLQFNKDKCAAIHMNNDGLVTGHVDDSETLPENMKRHA